jgi:hypothetical protein
MPGHSERNTIIQKFGELLNQDEPKLNLEVFKWLQQEGYTFIKHRLNHLCLTYSYKYNEFGIKFKYLNPEDLEAYKNGKLNDKMFCTLFDDVVLFYLTEMEAKRFYHNEFDDVGKLKKKLQTFYNRLVSDAKKKLTRGFMGVGRKVSDFYISTKEMSLSGANTEQWNEVLSETLNIFIHEFNTMISETYYSSSICFSKNLVDLEQFDFKEKLFNFLTSDEIVKIVFRDGYSTFNSESLSFFKVINNFSNQEIVTLKNNLLNRLQSKYNNIVFNITDIDYPITLLNLLQEDFSTGIITEVEFVTQVLDILKKLDNKKLSEFLSKTDEDLLLNVNKYFYFNLKMINPKKLRVKDLKLFSDPAPTLNRFFKKGRIDVKDDFKGFENNQDNIFILASETVSEVGEENFTQLVNLLTNNFPELSYLGNYNKREMLLKESPFDFSTLQENNFFKVNNNIILVHRS